MLSTVQARDQQILNIEPANENRMQTPTRANLYNQRSVVAWRAHRGFSQTMIDRNEFQRLLEIRVGSLLTADQFEQLTQRLLELQRPRKKDINKICEDITRCRLLQQSLADYDDLIQECTV